jgi:sulfur-oxidizing protein SoxX
LERFYFAIETIDITLRNDALTAFSRTPVLFILLVIAAGLASPAWAQSAVADGQKLAFDRGKGNCLTCHVINPQTMMPPFGRNRILTEQEISAIVDFLQTL